MQSFFRRAMAIDRAHGSCSQVQFGGEGDAYLTHAHRADQINESVFIARLFGPTLSMIVMNVNRFEPEGRLIFLAERVVNVEVDYLSLTTFFGLLNDPVDLGLEQFGTHHLGIPTGDAQEVGPIRGVGRLNELTL